MNEAAELNPKTLEVLFPNALQRQLVERFIEEAGENPFVQRVATYSDSGGKDQYLIVVCVSSTEHHLLSNSNPLKPIKDKIFQDKRSASLLPEISLMSTREFNHEVKELGRDNIAVVTLWERASNPL